MVSSYISPRPSQYALRHLEGFKYLKLLYLTQERCADTAQHQHTQSDDTFGLTKVDNVIALRQVSALRASKNVISDANLVQTDIYCEDHSYSADDKVPVAQQGHNGPS
jgi:hypothetical protein